MSCYVIVIDDESRFRVFRKIKSIVLYATQNRASIFAHIIISNECKFYKHRILGTVDR